MLFDKQVTADEVETEDDTDYFTGFTGGGPAFPALLAASMVKHAVARGIAPDIARRSVNALLVGTGLQLAKQPRNPSELVETFLDFKGTTAAAIETMLGEGLDAAFAKSKAMGQDR